MAPAGGGAASVLGLPGPRHLIFLLILSLGAVPLTQSRELRLVTLLYRHGDRSPVRTYPTDIHKESAWPQGFGQLSQVGMMQHWALGQALRSRYNGFLNDSYDRTQIYVRSTDLDRTLMSAESNLAGLYPPRDVQTFNPNITWQPIPVHTVPEGEDRLLKFPVLPCPRYLELQQETRLSAEFVNTTTENRSFMEMVANETGVKDVSLDSIWSIYDTLFCEQRHNMTLPSWATAEVLKRLEKLKNFSFQYLFGLHKPMEKARLQGGILLEQILKNFSEVTKSKGKQHLKVIMYSAHDTTIVALQTALNVYNGMQPPYASCHIMELFQEDSGNFSVEMYYRNDSGRSPFKLALPGCPHSCPLQDFLNLSRDAISQDRERECQIPHDTTTTEVLIGLIVCGVLLFLLIVLLLVVVFRLQSQPSGYNPVLNEGEDHA